MKKLFDITSWDHPLMFLTFLVLAAIPIGFVLHKAFTAVGFAPAANLTAAYGG